MENDIKIINNGCSQDVQLTIDGISKIIFHLDNTDSEYYCNFLCDGNYIIIYTTRIVDADDPIYMTRFRNAKAVYDLSTDELLDLAQETLYRIHDMYLVKKYFSIDVVLSLLTNHSFAENKSEVIFFRNYLTSFNDTISDEEIKNYILNCYPELDSFKNIKSLVFNRKKIQETVKSESLGFYSMKQDVKEYNNYFVEKEKQFRKKYKGL